MTSLDDKILENHKSTNRNQSKLIHKTTIKKTNNPLPFSFQFFIDIGDGRKGVIVINQNTQPLQSAIQFCNKFDLDQVIAGILSQSIRQKIEQQKKTVRFRDGSKSHQKFTKKILQNQKQNCKDILNYNILLKKDLKNIDSWQTKNRKAMNKITTEQKRQQDELHECTYKPHMNYLSRKIIDKLGRKSLLDQIHIKMKKKQEKIQKLKRNFSEKQFSECSFQPKINQISSNIDHVINKSLSNKKRYELLYEKALLSKSKHNSTQHSFQNLSFKPQMNRLSKMIVSRMNSESKQSIIKDKKSRQSCQKLTETKKKLTGRSPKNRNKQNLPVGEYLYNQVNKKAQLNIQPIENKFIVLSKSEDLFQQKKKLRLKQLFQQFDENKTGIISYKNLRITNNNQEIFQILKPIFQEMRQLKMQLNQAQFIQASSILFESLNNLEKNKILKTSKKSELNSKLSFKPKINKKSQVLESKDLYQKGITQKRMFKYKIQKQQEEKVRSQLHECTFKPKIIPYRNIVYTTNIN